MTEQARTRRLTRSRPESCLSDLVLDWLLASELDGTEARAGVEAHLSVCATCAARLRELEAARAAFVPPGRRRGRRPLFLLAGGAGALAAGLLVAFLATPPPAPSVRTELDGVRSKGSLLIDVVAKRRDGRVEQILPGSRLLPGEAIRFEVSTRSPGYLTIAGLDSAPAVTIYHPAAGGQAFIRPGRRQLLEGSITLDQTLGPERLIALLCDTPVPKARLVRVLEAALDGAGGDPRGVERVDLHCRQTTFLYEKIEAP